MFAIRTVQILCLCSLLFQNGHNAKILGVFPCPGRSQFILGDVLMTELARRGHNVTVITPYTAKMSNYKTIDTSESLFRGTDGDYVTEPPLFDMEKASFFEGIEAIYGYGTGITERTLQSAGVQQLLMSNATFDLVVLEEFFNDALKGFAGYYEAPVVLFSSMGLTEWNRYPVGYPALPALNPVSFTSYTSHMDLVQRVMNLAGYLFECWVRYRTWYHHEELLTRFFPKKLLLRDVVYNSTLMLLNSHSTTSENVLLPSNMVEVGGFHITKNPSPEPDLQKVLNYAPSGVILFSLGSNLKSSDLSGELREELLAAFAQRNETIIWKFEEELKHKLPNVYISKWINQGAVLAHKNTKLFVTHGGLLSILETTHFGVPFIGIPIFGDQKMNMARAEQRGVAKMIPFTKLSKDMLLEAINDVLQDSKYKEAAEKMSGLFRDRPVNPLALAVYWIEHTLRHKGFRFELATSHLYSFQFYLLDVFFLFLLLLFVFIKCILYLCNLSKRKPIGEKIKQK